MSISSNQFRAALGKFPAGVTIITSRNEDGSAVGATVSAFMSLSANPPLVLLSLLCGSRTAEAILSHRSFVVHFVNEATADLAMSFAAPTGDKFAGVRSSTTASGVEALLDCDTRLNCSLHAAHEGGDHTILIGHVDDIDSPETSDSHGVVWYRRQFCQPAAILSSGWVDWGWPEL